MPVVLATPDLLILANTDSNNGYSPSVRKKPPSALDSVVLVFIHYLGMFEQDEAEQIPEKDRRPVSLFTSQLLSAALRYNHIHSNSRSCYI